MKFVCGWSFLCLIHNGPWHLSPAASFLRFLPLSYVPLAKQSHALISLFMAQSSLVCLQTCFSTSHILRVDIKWVHWEGGVRGKTGLNEVRKEMFLVPILCAPCVGCIQSFLSVLTMSPLGGSAFPVCTMSTPGHATTKISQMWGMTNHPYLFKTEGVPRTLAPHKSFPKPQS